MQSNILTIQASAGYELLDSGDGEKLERFGDVVLARPDPQALWRKHLSPEDWKNADAVFTREDREGHWDLKKGGSEGKLGEKNGLAEKGSRWAIDFSGLKFWIKPTAFKHTGLFPEQSVNWDWTRETIKKALNAGKNEVNVLNLFGYTGGASLACAQAGAKVVHVDGSKSAITWARENAELSELGEKPIRWILEDARVFVERELKRGNTYDAVIMDPPSFGHGANKEIWKIEEDFLPLVEMCMQLLTPVPLFFLVNGYSAGYSPVAYRNTLQTLVSKYGGSIEIGELTIEESMKGGKDGSEGNDGAPRLLPCGIFARWRK